MEKYIVRKKGGELPAEPDENFFLLLLDGSPEEFEECLKNGADPNAEYWYFGEMYYTSLTYLMTELDDHTRKYCDDCIRTNIYGCDANCADFIQYYESKLERCRNIVKSLLLYGADPNIIDDFSEWSPIMAAALVVKDSRLVEILLQHGINDINECRDIADTDEWMCGETEHGDYWREVLRLIEKYAKKDSELVL